MSDRPFQRPGSPPHRREEPWPYSSPGVAEPSESAWTHLWAPPLPTLQQQGRQPPPTLPTPRLRGAAVMGAVGLLAGMVLEMVVADTTPPRPIPISVASFPVRLLGQMRIDADWRNPSSAPEVDRIATWFDAQLAAHRFAYGGDGASLDYGVSYTLTIVNGLVAVSLPAAGDPPSGDIPMVVTLRTSDTRCVSEQTHTAFESRRYQPPASRDHMGEADAAAAPGPRSGDRSAWTDCVLMDRQRNLTLRLVGDGPANDVNDTAGQFRDALQQVHAALVD